MATPGQLVHTTAEVLGIPRATVAQYDRQLAEAGLRTVKGRGKSAAQITPADAANLLITILGSPVSGPSIRVAQRTCEVFGALQVRSNFSDTRGFTRFGIRSLARLPKRHLFRDALTCLIEGASRGEIIRLTDGDEVLTEGVDICLGVRVEGMHPWAEITCSDSDAKKGRLVYNLTEPEAKWVQSFDADLHQSRVISYRTLRLLGNLISTGGT